MPRNAPSAASGRRPVVTGTCASDRPPDERCHDTEHRLVGAAHLHVGPAEVRRPQDASAALDGHQPPQRRAAGTVRPHHHDAAVGRRLVGADVHEVAPALRRRSAALRRATSPAERTARTCPLRPARPRTASDSPSPAWCTGAGATATAARTTTSPRQRPARRLGMRGSDVVEPAPRVLRDHGIDAAATERWLDSPRHVERIRLPRRRFPAFGAFGEERPRETPHLRRSQRRTVSRRRIGEQRARRDPPAYVTLRLARYLGGSRRHEHSHAYRRALRQRRRLQHRGSRESEADLLPRQARYRLGRSTLPPAALISPTIPSRPPQTASPAESPKWRSSVLAEEFRAARSPAGRRRGRVGGVVTRSIPRRRSRDISLRRPRATSQANGRCRSADRFLPFRVPPRLASAILRR